MYQHINGSSTGQKITVNKDLHAERAANPIIPSLRVTVPCRHYAGDAQGRGFSGPAGLWG